MPSPVGHALAGVAAGWMVQGTPPFRARTIWIREAALFGSLAVLPDADLLVGAHSGPTHGVGAAILVGLVACREEVKGADAPVDAAVADFCEVIGDLDVSDPEKIVDEMVEVGTPDGIPADARGGFEVMIDQATADEISEEDQAKVTAFIGYVTGTCSGIPVS